MQTTSFITLLVTPSLSRGYIDTLALHLPKLGVDWIMYRSQSDAFLPHFVQTLTPFHKTLLLNLPFTSLPHILESSLQFGGVHLKSHLLDYISPIKVAYDKQMDAKKLIGYSAHNVDEVIYALELGADYCTLSPICATPNKGKALGLEVFEHIPYALRSRVIALGGMTKDLIPYLQNLGVGGFAGIRCFGIAL